jgi:mono/diheme cytochrome c family protein
MTRCFLASLSLLLAFSCGSGTKPAPHTNGPQTSTPAKQAVPAAPPASPALLAQQKHGGELYARICAVCHGAKGEGYKADRASALAHPEFLASTTDFFLRVAITRGRPGTVMSAWSSEHGGPLSASDVDAIIAAGPAYLIAAVSVPMTGAPGSPYVGQYLSTKPGLNFWWGHQDGNLADALADYQVSVVPGG